MDSFQCGFDWQEPNLKEGKKEFNNNRFHRKLIMFLSTTSVSFLKTPGLFRVAKITLIIQSNAGRFPWFAAREDAKGFGKGKHEYGIPKEQLHCQSNKIFHQPCGPCSKEACLLHYPSSPMMAPVIFASYHISKQW